MRPRRIRYVSKGLLSIPGFHSTGIHALVGSVRCRNNVLLLCFHRCFRKLHHATVKDAYVLQTLCHKYGTNDSKEMSKKRHKACTRLWSLISLFCPYPFTQTWRNYFRFYCDLIYGLCAVCCVPCDVHIEEAQAVGTSETEGNACGSMSVQGTRARETVTANSRDNVLKRRNAPFVHSVGCLFWRCCRCRPWTHVLRM